MMAMKWSDDRRQRFLEALDESGVVQYACDAAGMSRARMYQLRREDHDFAEEWDSAIERSVDRIEQRAINMAAHGWDEPVFGRVARDTDAQIGTVRKYDTGLMRFILQRRRPERYSEKLQIDNRVTKGDSEHVDLSRLDDEELAVWERLLDKAAVDEGTEPAQD